MAKVIPGALEKRMESFQGSLLNHFKTTQKIIYIYVYIYLSIFRSLRISRKSIGKVYSVMGIMLVNETKKRRRLLWEDSGFPVITKPFLEPEVSWLILDFQQSV